LGAWAMAATEATRRRAKRARFMESPEGKKPA
jgi:hypothetical protein